ncbi:hypothetical protein [Bacillus massilinigeriensis]|uniref:hypothetical protein n=1 Tax=Bacillus massilionigeriensis TaxID=1805475 RepID=UPI00096B4DE8|nr:hypothetical protein [Bacillus massilionigeriensis]
MNAKLIFSFAAGLFLSSTILGGFYLSEIEANTNNGTSVKIPTEKEMKDKLTSSGYVIHTKEEFNKVIASVESEKNEKESSSKENKSTSNAKEKIIYRTFLTVSEGMTSIDVGKVLVRANIIDNAYAFSNRVEKKGLANNLRPGTYKIDSDMTADEVISIVFKK